MLAGLIQISEVRAILCLSSPLYTLQAPQAPQPVIFNVFCSTCPCPLSTGDCRALLYWETSSETGCQLRPLPTHDTSICYGLQEAVDKGWFRKERELTRPGSGIPDIAQILATALDIAQGVAFLHARDVVHGDLTGGMYTYFMSDDHTFLRHPISSYLDR